MITAVPPERLHLYGALFPGAQAQMVLSSVIEGHTEASCWTIGDGNDEAVLLWDKGNIVFYLAGLGSIVDVVESVASLFAGTIWPLAAAEGLRYFSVRVLSPQMEQVLPDMLRDVALHRVEKRFYAFSQPAISQLPEPALADVYFAPVNVDLLGSQLANVQHVAGEIIWMWPNMQRFYQNGLGIVAMWQDQVICWCTSEYVSRQACGIGIETMPAFQGKNVATGTAARFVAESLARGMRPHWECSAENPASARVAEKVGFTLVEEAQFWAGQFPEA